MQDMQRAFLPMERTCPEGHELQPFEPRQPGFGCDVCGEACVPGAGGRLFGCRQCDYDLCDKCSVSLPEDYLTDGLLRGPELKLARMSELHSLLVSPGITGAGEAFDQYSGRDDQHVARVSAMMAELVQIDQQLDSGDAAGAAARCTDWVTEARTLGGLGHKMAEGFILGRLGGSCGRLGRFAEAIAHHERGLAIAVEIGNRDMERQFEADADRARVAERLHAERLAKETHGGDVPAEPAPPPAPEPPVVSVDVLGPTPSASDKTRGPAPFQRCMWEGGLAVIESMNDFLRGPPAAETTALPQYAALLAAIKEPAALDDQALAAAGVAKIFHRRRLLRWAAQLRPVAAAAAVGGFERRGIHRAVVQLAADAAARFGAARRLLLADGTTAIEIKAGFIQRRALDEGQRVIRTHTAVGPGGVASTIAFAVGDRVLLERGGRAAVVGYERGAGGTDRFAVMEPTVQSGAHECNHGVGWVCAGAAVQWLGPEQMRLDMSFTTKDGCEELVKPLAKAAGGRSLVDILSDPLWPLARLSDPLLSGFLAAGFAALPAAGGTAWLIAVATVFASHAWQYVLADVASALELFEAKRATKVVHFFWYDIFTVNQDPSAQASLPPDYFYSKMPEILFVRDFAMNFTRATVD